MNWTGKQAGEGFEYHLLAIAAAMVVCINGSGAFSIDQALGRHEDAVAPLFESRAPLAHVGASAPDAE
jgi:hypothetical protein